MRQRAVTYRRISADREGRELGIERQAEDLARLADRLGLTITGDYVDNDLSASTRSRKRRPGYQQMLDDARARRFDAILAYTSGRLTRRPREHEDLIDLAEQYGIRFQYVASPGFDLNTAAGRRVARILAANDAGESEDISERVRRAAEQRARAGLNHGGRRSFGFTPGGLTLVRDEAAEIKRMAHKLLAGVPLGALTRDLNARGVRTVTGRPWAPGTVRGVLLRPRNAALAEYHGEIVGKGQWPAIITEDQHHAIVALIRDPSRRSSTGNRAAYLLSGIATCATCGAGITSGGVKPRQSSPSRRIYRCRAQSCVGRRQDWCDEYVESVVLARLSQPDAGELLAESNAGPDLADARAESSALRVRLDELADAFATGDITRDQLKRATAKIRGRLEELEGVQAVVSRLPVLRDLVSSKDIRTSWRRLGLDRQRAIVQTLMEIRIHPGGPGQRTFDPSKVEIIWKP
jgi:DNA invertase Pin-like site-specific DNA recombinase